MIVKKHQYAIILLILLVLASILRFYDIMDNSVWTDEEWTLLRIEWPVKDMLFGTRDVHPPLYFILLYGIKSLGFSSIEHIRMVSAFFGVASVFLIYKVGLLYNKRVAIIAATILTFSPLHIHFSRDGRMYIFLLFLILLSFLLLKWVLSKKYSRKILLNSTFYMVVSLLLVLTAYISVFVLFAQLVYVYIYHRKSFRRVFTLLLISAIVFTPFITVVLDQFKNATGASVFSTGVHQIAIDYFYGLYAFIGGYSTIILTEKYDSNNIYALLNVYDISLILLGITVYILMLQSVVKFKTARTYLALTIIPFLMPIIIYPYVSIVGYRYLVIIYPFFVLLLSITISSFKEVSTVRYYILICSVVLSSILGVYNIYSSEEYEHTDWNNISKEVENIYKEGDTIFVNNNHEILKRYLTEEYSLTSYHPIRNLNQETDNKLIDKLTKFSRTIFVDVRDPVIFDHYKLLLFNRCKNIEKIAHYSNRWDSNIYIVKACN